MKRTLMVLAVTHFLAMLFPTLLFIALVGWFVDTPPLKLAGLFFTCDAGLTPRGWVTGCYWQVPW